jgi:hypothetical protein
MTDTSRAPDWRNEADYQYIDELKSPDLRRWEFLRHSGPYRQAHAAGLLSNAHMTLTKFGIVGEAPEPSIRSDKLPPGFRFARYGEIHGKHPAFWPAGLVRATPPLSPLDALLRKKAEGGRRAAENILSMSEGLWAYDLERSVAEQVDAFEAHLLQLRAKLAEWQAAQPTTVGVVAAPAEPFDGLAGRSAVGDLTDEELRQTWLAEEDLVGATQIAPDRKPKEGQASIRLLQVLDALDAGATQTEIAAALFKGHAGNTSTAVKEALAAANAAATTWP